MSELSCPSLSAIATAEKPISMSSETWLWYRSCTRMRLTFAQTQPASVQDLERVEALRLVCYRVGKLQVLVLRPELHLAALGRPHPGSLGARVPGKPVVAHGVVEDGGELVVDRLQVRLRVGLAVRIAVRHEPVLPAHDVDGLDLVDAHLAEVREDLPLYHVLLRVPGVLAQSGHHARGVDVVEGREGGVHGLAGLLEELLLPCRGLGLVREASLGLVPLVAVVVAVPNLRRPCPVRFQSRRHISTPQSFAYDEQHDNMLFTDQT